LIPVSSDPVKKLLNEVVAATIVEYRLSGADPSQEDIAELVRHLNEALVACDPTQEGGFDLESVELICDRCGHREPFTSWEVAYAQKWKRSGEDHFCRTCDLSTNLFGVGR
jgi:hypothetical protein